MMRLLLTWYLAVGTLTANRSGFSASLAPSTRRWPCTPDCVCLAGGGDDVTRSRGPGLCVRSAEVGLLTASRLASVTRLSISGRPPSTLVSDPEACRHLSNVRRVLIDSSVGDVADWTSLFSVFNRLNELTIRNSSSAAMVALMLSGARVLPNLRRLHVSATSASLVDWRYLSTLSNLEFLDVSGNSIAQLTVANATSCDDHDDGPLTFTPVSLAIGRCGRSNDTVTSSPRLRVFNASRNHIDNVEVGLFNRKSGRKLEVIDLSFNQLSRIDNGTFVDLFALHCLNLSHNDIGDIELDAFTMTSDDLLSSWKSHGSHGDVSYQATGKQREEQYYISLASCTRGWLNIQVVDLSYNKLTSLRQGLMEQAMCAVRCLILSNNLIDSLPRYLFEHLPYLTHLDLSNNSLAWLDVGTFTNPSLAVIDLSGNKLRKIVSMTFLYLPALNSVDLARNEISYVYKFAFYRMCSVARHTIHVSLRANQLDVDAVWKLLTTFEHLENPDCRVAVDLSDNRIGRFLAPDTLAFVRKRLVAAVADRSDASSQLRHFQRWDHVNVDLTENPIHCDCTLSAELRTVDGVLGMIGNGSKTGSDVISKSWRRLDCREPAEHAGLAVGTFVSSIAPSMCDSFNPARESPATSYGVCSNSASEDDIGMVTAVNCSGRQLSQFPTTSTRDSVSTDVGVRTLDLSHNQLRSLRVELLRRIYPELRVLYLQDNLITSLPVGLFDGSLPLTSLTLAGNPLVCDCAQPWLGHSNVVRLAGIVSDWVEVKCADGRPLSRFAARDYRCAGQTEINLHPGVAWSISVTLGSVLAIVTCLTLVGLGVRLVRWAAGGRLRRTKIYDVVSADGGIGHGSRSTMLVLVVYCCADNDWVRYKLMPILRQSSSGVTSGVRISLKTIDRGKRSAGARQLAENLKRCLAECQLAIVVVSPNFVAEISRHGDALLGILGDTAVRCVMMSPGPDSGVAGASDLQTVRRVFGGDGGGLMASHDDLAGRMRAEMTSLASQLCRSLPLHQQLSREFDDDNEQLMNDEKY